MIKASVVIPAFNAEKTIGSLLDLLVVQDYPPENYEVIVVDDGSTDKTLNVLSEFKIQSAKFKILRQNHLGAGAARNLGAGMAKGDILLFTDSDCLVPKNWIKNHLKSHQKHKDITIIGGGVKKPTEGTYLAWTDFLSSWFNAHEDLPKHEVGEYLPSLNLSLKREIFKTLGGFWEKKLTGEDVDFCFRARQDGVKILFDPELAVWHQSPTLKGFFKHNFAWGYHAPFIRGKEKDLAYHWLFSGEFIKTLALFLPLSLGKTIFLASLWLGYQPFRFLVCLPLIFLGQLAYAFGTLAGSWQKSFLKK